jgi:hypothetical protein
MMGLVDEGDDTGSTVYSLGGGTRFLMSWGTVSDETKDGYRKIIIADTDEVCVCVSTPPRYQWRVRSPLGPQSLKVSHV